MVSRTLSCMTMEQAAMCWPVMGCTPVGWDQDGVQLIWTVTPSRSGSLSASGHVLIEARAVYAAGEGQREVRVGTLRANPVFVGSR